MVRIRYWTALCPDGNSVQSDSAKHKGGIAEMHSRNKNRNKDRLHSCWIFLASTLGWLSPAGAQIIVDDFVETGQFSFPLEVRHPVVAYLGAPNSVESVFAGARSIDISSLAPADPTQNPTPNDTWNSIDVSSATGVLSAKSGANAKLDFHIGWRATLNSPPADVDVSKHPKLLLKYSSNHDLSVSITLSNQMNRLPRLPPVISGGSSKEFLFPATAGGRFVIDITDISEPLTDSFGVTRGLPLADFTSLDYVSIHLVADQPNSVLALEYVAFVPEPTISASILLGIATVLLSPRWPTRTS